MVISVSRSILYPARKFALMTVASIALAGCQSAIDPELATTTDQEPVSGFLRTAAETSQSSRNYAAAVGYYQSLYSRDPSDPEIALGLAQNLRYIGSAEQSLDILRAALLEHPDRTDLKAEAGKSLLAVGETDAALETLTEVAKAEPDNWQVLSALGIAYDQFKEYDKAQAQYQAALDISPNNISVLNNLALSMALSGNIDEGLAILKRTMGMRKAGVQVRQNLALLYAMRGDMETAERLIKQDLPVVMAEQNIEYYERVYGGEFTNPSAALSEELSPDRRLAMEEGEAPDVAVPPESVVGSVESSRLETEATAVAAVSHEAIAGIPDVDAAAEPVSVTLTGFADREGVAPVTPRLVAGLDSDAGRQPTHHTGADFADSGFDTPASRPQMASPVVAAAIPDVDAAAEPVSVALAGFEDQEGAAPPVAPRPIAGLDADAGRRPMHYTGADLADSGFDTAASRPQMAPPVVDGIPDVDAEAEPVSVALSGFEDREGVAPVAPRLIAGIDADAGRLPTLYRDSDVADRSSDGAPIPAGVSPNRTISVAGAGFTGSDDLEFDLGDAEEAVIATGAAGMFETTGLDAPSPAPADAALAEVGGAGAPKRTPADPRIASLPPGDLPSDAPNNPKSGTGEPSDDALTSVLAQFIGRLVAPTETDVADASEPSRSFAYGAGRAMGRPGARDQNPTETARPQSSGDTDAPVVAALAPVPPAPIVDFEATPASREIMLQFGSFPSLNDATRWLVTLRKSHADLLSGVRFQIKSADDGQAKPRYRLIAGPMENEAAAVDLCERLEGFREDCEIFESTGDVAKSKASQAG